MAEKRCAKCGEMVDEAKAFCPGCGHSFVDEKQRETVSDFDQSNRTVQLGETMFNQMLSEMGLNISKQHKLDDIDPDAVGPMAPPEVSRSAESTQVPAPVARRTKMIWIGVAVLAAVVFAIVVMLITLAVLINYYR